MSTNVQRELLCEECLKCQGSHAELFCEACGTFLCAACDVFIHSTKGLKSHFREKLDRIGKKCNVLCQARNIASIHCGQCMMDFCFECDQQWHTKGKRKDHCRVSTIHCAKDDPQSASSSCFLLINDKEELMVRSLTNAYVNQLFRFILLVTVVDNIYTSNSHSFH